MTSVLDKVLRIYRQANLNLNKDKCLFQWTSISFFGEVILSSGVSPDPRKVQVLMAMPLPKYNKELQSFLGLVSYLSKFSPMTAEVFKPLQQLILVKKEW